MDTSLDEFPSSINKFAFNQGSVPAAYSNQNLVDDEFETSHENTDPSFFRVNPDPSSDLSSSPGLSLEVNSPDSESNAALKYISEMLMEEELENRPCMLQDCLALQAAEKSLHEALVSGSPSSTSTHSSTDSFAASSNWVGADWDCVQGVSVSSHLQTYTLTVPNPFVSNGNSSFPAEPKELGKDVSFGSEKDGSSSPEKDGSSSPNGSRSKKNRQREDGDYLDEGRSNKQSAAFTDESELLELFDQVLLCQGENQAPRSSYSPQESEHKEESGRKSRGSKGKKTRKKKPDENTGGVDLWTLLTQCAQAVASYDIRTANEQLKQIRHNSSPSGDGTQRLAHYFANGLEQRLSAGVPSYNSLPSNYMSAAVLLKAYQTYITACPFKRMSNIYANRTIKKLAENATRLHIIDFGVLYGYQWPCLIQALAKRHGGPPMLRITGIEFPQPGFRPSERVEETGRRLENYCKRFKVPFAYNVIAKNWETIQYEDIKIDRDELIVVNCLYRLKNLPDETVTNSPRDIVLKLIRRINPDMFIHGVVNGSYNAPFFDTRFREALFHFSSLFDMFEETLPREDQQRLHFEKEVFGRDAINVIACEGSRRVERPETYKQWQIRNKRAGFRQLPLDQDLLKQVRDMVKADYHKDFVVDEDGMWVLQGWKGRIIQAISYWKPI